MPVHRSGKINPKWNLELGTPRSRVSLMLHSLLVLDFDKHPLELGLGPWIIQGQASQLLQARHALFLTANKAS